MLRTSLLALCAFVGAAFAQEPARKIAFDRGGDIWVANLDGKAAKKLTKGSWPDMSPDGTRVAFNTEGESPKEGRIIAIADVATGKRTLLKDVPSDNSFGPRWSPDGKSLLFNILAEGDWQIGFIQADGTGFRFAKKAAAKYRSFYAATFAADGRSFFCHDLDYIYHCALDGTEQQKWKIQDVLEHAGLNSGNAMDVSPDGTKLILDVDMDEDVKRKNWEGPPPSVCVLDVASGKSTRLAPKGVFAWEPRWISDDEYVFIVQAPGENEPSIYRTKVGAKEKTLIAKKARTPSVSR